MYDIVYYLIKVFLYIKIMVTQILGYYFIVYEMHNMSFKCWDMFTQKKKKSVGI